MSPRPGDPTRRPRAGRATTPARSKAEDDAHAPARRDGPVITLLTDFGVQDWYVGAMKAVLARMAPRARIVDLCHGVPPFEIPGAAFVLHQNYQLFPQGSVHVAVVDPGVGGERRAIALRAQGHAFVGPDNSLLTGALWGGGPPDGEAAAKAPGQGARVPGGARRGMPSRARGNGEPPEAWEAVELDPARLALRERSGRSPARRSTAATSSPRPPRRSREESRCAGSGRPSSSSPLPLPGGAARGKSCALGSCGSTASATSSPAYPVTPWSSSRLRPAPDRRTCRWRPGAYGPRVCAALFPTQRPRCRWHTWEAALLWRSLCVRGMPRSRRNWP